MSHDLRADQLEDAAFGRAVVDLDGTWQFTADPAGSYVVETLPDGGVPIVVPGSWEEQIAGRYGIGAGWYRRAVHVPAGWQGGQIVTRFGAVMVTAQVWLNGALVGEHEGGFTPFEVDLSQAARLGAENDLVIRVSNPLNTVTDYPPLPLGDVLYAKDRMGRLPLAEVPHGKQTWYTSLSGIWQSVRMECRPMPALRRLQVTPNLNEGRARISWYLTGPGGSATLGLRLLDPDGRHVVEQAVRVAAGTDSGEVTLAIPEPRAWGSGTPNLYTIEATLTSDAGARDELTERFGMRSIESRDGHLMLNGEPIYVAGVLDQDVYPAGLSVPGNPRAYYREQFQRVKEMGLNLVRCHIKVPDPAYLDAADEAGVLLWCELPNWSHFSTRAAMLGKATLQAMVETMGNHPSIVIWTIINEDWGTRLKQEARDRRWLLGMYAWLKQLDPTRLVVDNSACETTNGKPNFHLQTDIADFHAYFSMPDRALRWRNLVEDMAGRPAWLWSPHGDARSRGDEPLVMSEFGNWGLPNISGMSSSTGEDPWWFRTGRQLYQPAGAEERFHHLGLGRIWPDWSSLAAATQWQQFEALQYQIGELRRHPEIRGHVITELTDAYWEANGLLDLARGRKVFHDRLVELNGPHSLTAEFPRRDLWGGDELACEISLSSCSRPDQGARVAWTVTLDEGARLQGALPLQPQQTDTIPTVRLGVRLPEVPRTTSVHLELEWVNGAGDQLARGRWLLAVLPSSRARTQKPRRVAIEDPLGIWDLERRLAEMGHERASLDEADLLITTELTMTARHFAEGGGRVLVLVRSRAALPPEVELQREIQIHPRWLSDETGTDPLNPWRGDWISTFNWILPGVFPDLPQRNPLDFSYQEVIPDHVLRGYHPQKHAAEVPAGVFVGWVHAPAALLWSFAQGKGQITVTTFKLSPERGPVATVLFEDLIQRREVASDASPVKRVLHRDRAGSDVGQ